MKPILRLLPVAFVLLTVAGCGGSGKTPSSLTNTTGSVTAVATYGPPAAEVSWTGATLTTSQSFIAFNVYRDGTAIATLGQSKSTYSDSTAGSNYVVTYTTVPSGSSTQATSASNSVTIVLTGVSHTYTVTEVYLDSTTPGQTVYREVGLGSAAVTINIASTVVTAAASSKTAIAVNWTAPSLTTGQSLIAYNVYRDNQIVASESGSTQTFTDATTTATHELTYSIVVAGSASGLSTATTSVTPVTTGAAHTYTVTAVYLDTSVSPATYHEVSLGTSSAVTLTGS